MSVRGVFKPINSANAETNSDSKVGNIENYMTLAREKQTLFAMCEGFDRNYIRSDYSNTLKYVQLILNCNDSNLENKISSFIKNKSFNALGEIQYGAVWIYFYSYTAQTLKEFPVFKIYDCTSKVVQYFDTNLNVYDTWDLLIEKLPVPESIICFPRNGIYETEEIEGKVILKLEYVCKTESKIQSCLMKTGFQSFHVSVIGSVLNSIEIVMKNLKLLKQKICSYFSVLKDFIQKNKFKCIIICGIVVTLIINVRITSLEEAGRIFVNGVFMLTGQQPDLQTIYVFLNDIFSSFIAGNSLENSKNLDSFSDTLSKFMFNFSTAYNKGIVSRELVEFFFDLADDLAKAVQSIPPSVVPRPIQAVAALARLPKSLLQKSKSISEVEKDQKKDTAQEMSMQVCKTDIQNTFPNIIHDSKNTVVKEFQNDGDFIKETENCFFLGEQNGCRFYFCQSIDIFFLRKFFDFKNFTLKFKSEIEFEIFEGDQQKIGCIFSLKNKGYLIYLDKKNIDNCVETVRDKSTNP